MDESKRKAVDDLLRRIPSLMPAAELEGLSALSESEEAVLRLKDGKTKARCLWSSTGDPKP